MIDKKILDGFNIKLCTYDEAIERMTAHHQANGSPGLLTPYSCLNNLYTVMDSSVTDWTGAPGSGKTLFALDLLIGMSEKYGKRYALYVPDIGSEEIIYEQIFKMMTGFDFHDKYNNKIEEKIMYRYMSEIIHRFPVIQKKNRRKGITPQEVWEFTAGYKDDSGVGLDGCLIDSWKNLKHEYSGREDSYLDEVLSYRNEIAEEENIHIHTIAHTTKISTDKDGRKRIATASDIKGGESWSANGKNIITVDYPDKTSTGVSIYVNKIKPNTVGRVGSISNTLFYNRSKGRYYEMINGFERYAFDYEGLDGGTQSEMYFTNNVQSEPLPF